MWKRKGSTIFIFQGLTSKKIRRARLDDYERHVESHITTMEGIGISIHDESTIQEKLEATGYSSPTWRLQRALQSTYGAVCVQGESAVTAPPFFKHAGRGATNFWGDSRGWQREPTIFLWEALDDQGRQQCIEIMQQRTDCVVWARRSPSKREARLHGEFETYGRVLVGQEVKGKATMGAGDERTRGKKRRQFMQMEGLVETRRCQSQDESMANVVLGSCDSRR